MISKIGFKDVSENRAAWTEYRKDKIGSSEVAIIVGLNKFKSALELWCEKTGKTTAEDLSDNKYVRRGRIFEKSVRELFAETHPYFDVVANDITFEMADHPWAIATHDSEIIPKYSYFQAVEAGCIQTPVSSLEMRIEPMPEFEIYPNEIGGQEIKVTKSYEGWEDGAPDYAHIQLIWELGVRSLNWGFVSGFVCGEEKNKFFRYDQQVFDKIFSAAEAFLDCVKKDIPPSAGAGDSLLIQKLISVSEKQIDLPVEQYQLVENYQEATKQKEDLGKEIKFWEAKQKEAKNNLILFLGGQKASKAILPTGDILSIKLIEQPAKTISAFSYYNLSIKKGK